MSRILRRFASLTVLFFPVSGCVTVQNRYSVFGLDRFQTESLAQAKTWSLVFLVTVSFISMCVGACGLYLAHRLWRWWKADSLHPSYGLPPEDRCSSTIESGADVEFSSNSVKQAG
jgi:hypothetical protein